MTKKTYYVFNEDTNEYTPVSEYDSDFLDSYNSGCHLVVSVPGLKLTRYNINPDYASVIAASLVAHEAMVSAMIEESNYKPSKTPLTPEQIAAWKALSETFGQEITLRGPSYYDVVNAGVAAMQKEASKLLEVPAVKKAWDHFQLVCEMTKTA